LTWVHRSFLILGKSLYKDRRQVEKCRYTLRPSLGVDYMVHRGSKCVTLHRPTFRRSCCAKAADYIRYAWRGGILLTVFLNPDPNAFRYWWTIATRSVLCSILSDQSTTEISTPSLTLWVQSLWPLKRGRQKATEWAQNWIEEVTDWRLSPSSCLCRYKADKCQTVNFYGGMGA
jgi:hypothetical protein